MRAIPSRYKYVRRVKDKWQARVWDDRRINSRGGRGDHVNLGLYDEEREAYDAVRGYFHRGEVPDHLEPKYVRTRGVFFAARVTMRGGTVSVGACLWPEAAQALLFMALRRRHPAKFKAVLKAEPAAALAAAPRRARPRATRPAIVRRFVEDWFGEADHAEGRTERG